MRNAWKLLFTRPLPRFSPAISAIGASCRLQVRSSKLPNLSSLPSFLAPNVLGHSIVRPFSSEPAVDLKKDQDHSLLAEIFSRPISFDEIKAELDSVNPSLDQDTVHSVLLSLENSPENAKRFFDWVREREEGKDRILRSKSYDLMLKIVSKDRKSEEFWGLIEVMKGKGYRISKETFLKVSENFKTEGMEKDLKLLEQLYLMKTPEIAAARLRRFLLKEDGELEVIHAKLQDLRIDLSSELVVVVLGDIGSWPEKAKVFYKWVEANPSFEIDARVANAMARILGRQDCINDFWEILHKMRNSGFEMEKETYFKVVNRFFKRKMILAAVELFEFSMKGSEKPSYDDFLFLLKKTVVSTDLDMSLVSKVVQIFKGSGNSIKFSAFESVLKSLRSASRLEECDKVLKAMEEGGFMADSNVFSRVVVGLCDAGKLNEALEYADNIEKAGTEVHSYAWSSLVHKNSLANQLDKAVICFKKMVERKGGENVCSSFEVLVHEFCKRKCPEDASKLLKEMVTKKNVKPWQTTYKFLIERLLSLGNIKEASSLLEAMKSQGFPPLVDPFMGFFTKSGTADDALSFLKAMTVHEFPSTRVFVRVFEALLKEGRHQVAHDLLSLSPGHVRNHADVLDLFHSMKPSEAAAAAAL